MEIKKQELGPLQTEWLTQLRTGGYSQGRAILHSATGQFCCLGVACAVFHTRLSLEVDRVSVRRVVTYDRCEGVLPDRLVAALGLHSSVGEPSMFGWEHNLLNIVHYNDMKKWDFPKIADHLTTYAAYYFKEPK